MAPPRGRGSARKQVGLGRMDAACDAMHFLGFPRDVVRKTVRHLLQVYGGDEGWLFIEEACYKVLIDTILEQQEQGETEKPTKVECSSEQDEENGNDHSSHEHTPSASPSQPSMQIVACTMKNDTPEEECKIAPKSIKVESSPGHDSLLHSTSRSTLPSCLTDSFQDKKLALQIQSKEAQARLPRQRRKPCFGWISSDEEEEEDVLTLVPKA